MRLVIVAHAFPRWAGDVAGSFLGRLAENLVRHGHTVAVVAPADRGRGGRFTLGGVEVLQVRYASPERETLAYTGEMLRQAKSPMGAWTFLRLVRALAAGVRAEERRINAQLVHAFWWVPGGWAASGSALPVVLSLLGTDVTMMRLPPARMLARRVAARCACVTALSTYLAAHARRLLRMPGLDIVRIPVPVDVGRFAPSGSGGGGVVYLGRLTRQKRVDLLLRALHAVRLDVPVTIVGDGPARGELEDLTRALHLANVRFRGALPDEEIPAVLGSADAAAFPSRDEGLGLAAAEAQMSGVPVVATADGGGVLDLVHDGEGAFIVAPTPEAVGAALRRCLADPGMRAAAVSAGNRLRTQLSPDTIAAEFARVYARVA